MLLVWLPVLVLVEEVEAASREDIEADVTSAFSPFVGSFGEETVIGADSERIRRCNTHSGK